MKRAPVFVRSLLSALVGGSDFDMSAVCHVALSGRFRVSSFSMPRSIEARAVFQLVLTDFLLRRGDGVRTHSVWQTHFFGVVEKSSLANDHLNLSPN